jgi:tetratricopeptide (TPR) repeat protein
MFSRDDDYEFNWKALWIPLLVLLVVAPCLFFYHRMQLGRLETYLLGEIESAKATGDQDETIKRLNRFMVYRPEAPKQKVELTELLADPKSPKLKVDSLIPLIYQSIATCEQNPELEDKLPSLRMKLLDNLSQAMRAGEAVEQIAKLAKQEPESELDKKLALIRYRNLVVAGEDPSVGRLMPGTPDWIQQKCKLDPVDHIISSLNELKGDVELTAMLGNACLIDSSKLVKSNLSKLDKQELDSLMSRKLSEMLSRNPDRPEAWLINYQLVSRIDQKRASEDIETALNKFPDDTSVLQQGAVHIMGLILDAKRTGNQQVIDKQIGQAEEILGKLRAGAGARIPFTYASLSELDLVKGDKEKAIQTLEDGLRVCEPPLVDLQLRLAQIYNLSNDSEMALEALKKADETLRQDSPRLNGPQQTEFARAIKQQWLEYYNAQGNLVAVNEQLDSLLVSTASSDTNTELRIQAFAAEAFRKIGYWDKASSAFLRALALAPKNDTLHRGAAECLVKSNRTEDAIKQFELIQNKQPGDWMQIALLRMLRQKTDLSFDESQWKPIQTALDQARKSAESTGQDSNFTNLLEVLQADLDARKSNPAKRAETIAQWKPKLMEMGLANANQELLLKNIVNLLGLWGEITSAKEIRKLLIEQNPDSLDAHLDKATDLANSGQVSAALDYLVDRLTEFQENIRLNQFIVGILQIDDRLGNRVEKMLDSCGNNFSVMSDLCEYLLRLPQYTSEVNEQDKAKSLPKVELWNAAMQNAEMRLRKLEGEKGTAWRYNKARRLLIKSLFDDRPDFANVLDLIRQIEEARPEWAYLDVLRGALAEQMKEPNKAIKAYQSAVGLAIDDIRVYERLIELLYQEGRFEDAETYISRLGNVSNQSNRIASVALKLSERTQANTLDLARLGTESRPLDPLAWVWYAKVIERSSREMNDLDRKASMEQAESHLQRARQLAPDMCEPVRALFQFYAASSQIPKIEEVVQQVETDKQLSPENERLNLLGIMHLYLNNFDRAEDSFNKSIAGGGSIVSNSLLRAEAMMRQGRRKEAVELLTQTAKNKPESFEIRQSLALLLADRGTPEDWKQIDDLLTAPPFGNSLEDRLLHAKLLITKRSYGDLEKAKEKLQGVAGVRSKSSNEVLYTLGTINRYLLDLSNRDNIKNVDTRRYQDAAESALQQAAQSTPSNENYITGYASFLIERNKLQDVAPLIDKLAALSPDSRATYLVRTLWHYAKNQNDLASKVASEWFQKATKVDYSNDLDLSKISDANITFANAIFEASGNQSNSDRTFEAILDRNPQIARNYINALLRHDISRLRNAGLSRLTERIDDLNLSSFDLSVFLSVIAVLEFDQDKTDALVSKITDKLNQATDLDMVALVSIGDFLLAKRRAPEALIVYKRIVEKEPKNPAALNNVANIIIETSPEKADEALGYISRAVELLPENSVLLDTKGTVLILLKRYEEAAQALSIATKNGGDPRSALHWYMALVGAGKTEEAEKVKPMIDRKTLRDVYLLPEDKAVLEKL